MKEGRMDVEPCYPLFSDEIESAEALTSSQQKFQTFGRLQCYEAITAHDACLLPHVPGGV